MRNWIVVPVKAPGAGKTRLAPVLDEEGRRRLVRDMLGHVLREASGIADTQVMILGPSRHGLPEGIGCLADPGTGLNGAAASALVVGGAARVRRVLILPADLPLLTRAEIASLLCLPPDTVGLAADLAGQGTNGLSVPLPGGRAFRFAYGAGSFTRHCQEAARLGLATSFATGRGLARDIDTPADLACFLAAPAG